MSLFLSPMDHTSLSLLQELRTSPTDEAWQRLVHVYDAWFRSWLSSYGIRGSEQDDLVQEILLVLMKKLPDFEHSGHTGAFRSWLKTLTLNCVRRSWRSRRQDTPGTGDSAFLSLLNQLEDPASDMSRVWNQQHDRVVMQRLLDLVRAEVDPVVWKAFYRHGVDGITASMVAEELGVTANYVYVAKSRVMSRLRTLAKGILDELP